MKKCRVLIVSDAPLFVDVISRILEKDDIEVIDTVNNFEEAQSTLNLRKVEAIVIDYDDAQRQDAKAISELISNDEECQIILLTMTDNKMIVYHRERVENATPTDVVRAIRSSKPQERGQNTDMTNNQESSGNELYVPSILALLFIFSVAALVWATQIKPVADQTAAERAGAAGANEVTGAAAPAESKVPVDMDAVIAAINKGGCVACHTIPGIPDAFGQVGPNLSNIGVDAASRREGYTAEAYIHESLAEPNAFIAPECPLGPCIAGTMPSLQLDETEIDVLVSYLSTLGN